MTGGVPGSLVGGSVLRPQEPSCTTFSRSRWSWPSRRSRCWRRSARAGSASGCGSRRRPSSCWPRRSAPTCSPTSARSRIRADQRIVTVALVLILFDGGMHIGLSRFRPVAGGRSSGSAWPAPSPPPAPSPCSRTLLFGFDWQAALLLGTALAPTDPAVVFSVLGRREVVGRSGTLLEGESGANDPVGIALMISLLGATGGGWHAVGHGAVEFALQMVLGIAFGRGRGSRCGGCCSTSRCPTRRSTRCATVAFGLLLYGVDHARARVGLPRGASSPGSWSATPGRRTSARSSGSPRPPAASARSSPSPCSGLSIPISEAFGARPRLDRASPSPRC